MKEIRSEGREERHRQAKQVSVSEHLPEEHNHLRHCCVHSAHNDFNDLQWLLLHVL